MTPGTVEYDVLAGPDNHIYSYSQYDSDISIGDVYTINVTRTNGTVNTYSDVTVVDAEPLSGVAGSLGMVFNGDDESLLFGGVLTGFDGGYPIIEIIKSGIVVQVASFDSIEVVGLVNTVRGIKKIDAEYLTNADWNEESGDSAAFIKNKPFMTGAFAITEDKVIDLSGSSNPGGDGMWNNHAVKRYPQTLGLVEGESYSGEINYGTGALIFSNRVAERRNSDGEIDPNGFICISDGESYYIWDNVVVPQWQPQYYKNNWASGDGFVLDFSNHTKIKLLRFTSGKFYGVQGIESKFLSEGTLVEKEYTYTTAEQQINSDVTLSSLDGSQVISYSDAQKYCGKVFWCTERISGTDNDYKITNGDYTIRVNSVTSNISGAAVYIRQNGDNSTLSLYYAFNPKLIYTEYPKVLIDLEKKISKVHISVAMQLDTLPEDITYFHRAVSPTLILKFVESDNLFSEYDTFSGTTDSISYSSSESKYIKTNSPIHDNTQVLYAYDLEDVPSGASDKFQSRFVVVDADVNISGNMLTCHSYGKTLYKSYTSSTPDTYSVDWVVESDTFDSCIVTGISGLGDSNPTNDTLTINGMLSRLMLGLSNDKGSAFFGLPANSTISVKITYEV